MKFEELVGRLSTFDMATLVELFDEDRQTAANRLHRWSAAGTILPLKRDFLHDVEIIPAFAAHGTCSIFGAS